MSKLGRHDILDAFPLSTDNLLKLAKHLLEDGRYWTAEKLLEDCFHQRRRVDSQQHVEYPQLEEAWTRIRGFVANMRRYTSDEEQELWATIAILQTFCEGVLNVCYDTNRLEGLGRFVPFETVTWMLRDLVAQALSFDHSGEWSRSRGFIRQKLFWLDKDVITNLAFAD